MLLWITRKHSFFLYVYSTKRRRIKWIQQRVNEYKKTSTFPNVKNPSYKRRRRRACVHAIEYENAVRRNRVFHVSPISKKASGIRTQRALSLLNSHDQSSPVPVFACCKYMWTPKKHHAFLSLLSKKPKERSLSTTTNVALNEYHFTLFRFSPSWVPLRRIFSTFLCQRKLLP